MRLYYLAAAAGFAMSALATWAGSGPSWPNRVTFGVVAMFASTTTVLYVATWHEVCRRLMVGAVVIAACARSLGWAISTEHSVAFRVGAAGALMPIAALMLVANAAARRGL